MINLSYTPPKAEPVEKSNIANSTEKPEVKILLTGHHGVGKSCLKKRFTHNVFEETINTSTSCDSKSISLQNKLIKILVSDEEPERFRNITHPHMRHVNIFFLIYDVTDMASFKDIVKFNNEIDSYSSRTPSIRVLVGTKADLTTKKIVEFQQGVDLRSQLKLDGFFEVSSKLNANIETLFSTSIEFLLNLQKKEDEKTNPPSAPSSNSCVMM